MSALAIDCSIYKTFQTEDAFLQSKNGHVDSIILIIQDPTTATTQILNLQMNKKPQTRVQLLKLQDAKQEIPESWRNLAGLAPKEVVDYFARNYKIISQKLLFVEYAGFGGKKVLWNAQTGIEACTQK